MRTLIAAALLWGSAQAFDLPELIESAHNNEQVQAYVDREKAAKLSYKSANSSYYPSVDLGASASLLNNKGTLDPGQTYKAYAEANFVILDGFRRENLLDEKTMSAQASRFDLEGYKKALSLQVINLYLDLEKVYADVKALEKNREQLNEQLSRLKLFFSAGIATSEDVERLKAAVANADYLIAARQFEIDSLRSRLELLSGRPLEGEQTPRRIEAAASSEAETLDRLKALDYRTKAVGYLAEQSDASNYPTIALNDTFTYSRYEDFDPGFPVEFPDKQNRLTVTASINLFDYSAASEQRQALKMEQHALEQELRFAEKSAEADRLLALKAIDRAQTLIEAALKSKEASDKTLAVVQKKYEARIVDYIRYLDALSKATEAQAQYNQAFSGLNSAIAAYIYNLGKDPKEYVR